jgi:hypothetical protein
MEMRAPLLYYEHAGKFEEADGECAEDTQFRAGYASWSVCASGVPLNQNKAASEHNGPGTGETDSSLRPGGLGQTMSMFLMETSDR